MLDQILNFFLSWVQQLHTTLLLSLDKVESAENVEVLVGLATLVILLSVGLWVLNLIKSILGASVSILEHTVNLLKRIAKYSGFALMLLLLIYYIFAIERQCFTSMEQDFTQCLNSEEWAKKSK